MTRSSNHNKLKKIGLFFVAAAVALSTDLFAAQIFQVTDFGAIPDDGQNDQKAIQLALNELSKTPGATLQFAPGTYHLDSSIAAEKDTATLLLRGGGDVVVDGTGAQMIIRNQRVGFLLIRECDGLTVRGFTIDFDPVPFALGRVTGVFPGEGSFVMETLSGYPRPDNAVFSGGKAWGYFIDPAVPGKLADGQNNVVFRESMTCVGGDLFRVQLGKDSGKLIRNLKPGTLATQLAREGQLFLAGDSSNLVFENITSYASASGHYVGSNVENIRVENCQALIKPGRYKGGNADGVHLQNVRGPIVVRGCTFEGISDDCVNLYQKPHYLLERRSSTEWRLSSLAEKYVPRTAAGTLRSGDTLQAYDSVTGVSFGRAKIKTFDPATGWAKLESGWNVPESSSGWKEIRIYADGFGSDFVIENNIFKDSRRYGIFLKGHRGVISGNRFIRLSSSAIYASNETGHEEGGFCGDVRIENNVIEDCGFESNFFSNEALGMITFQALKKPFVPVELKDLHRNITVSGNAIRGCPRGLMINCVAGLKIEDNSFEAMAAGRISGTFPAELKACTDVVEQRNNFIRPAELNSVVNSGTVDK